MIILGLGGLQGGGACAVLKDGTIVAAIEESKLSRGSAAGSPRGGGGGMPASGRRRAAMRWIAWRWCGRSTRRCTSRCANYSRKAEVAVVEHHLAHAASAFFASPFENATVLTLDHTGDFGCGARWNAQGNQLQLEKEWQYPDSLAWLYSAVTELLGYPRGRRRTQSAVALHIRRRPLP